MNSKFKWPLLSRLSLPRFSLPRGLWPRRRELDEGELADLEASLGKSLVPVEPRRAFVNGLKGRLMAAPEPQLPSMSPALQYTLLGALGLVSGMIILVTGIRATVTLLGAIGLLSQFKKPERIPGTLRPPIP